MYFLEVYLDVTELSKARNTLRRKMHPDKLDPNLSQVEKDAAATKYSAMEAEADAKIAKMTAATMAASAPKESTTSNQPSDATKTPMDPEVKAKKPMHPKVKARKTQLKVEIQKNYPMIVKAREYATKKTAAAIKSRGIYNSDRLRSCEADKAVAAAEAYTTEREVELKELNDSDGNFEDQTKKELQQKIAQLEMQLESALSELRRKNYAHDNLLTDK